MVGRDEQGVLFITYSDKDEFQVQQIASELRKQSIPVFAYPYDIPGGASIVEGIRAQPKNKILAVALSQNSIDTSWIKETLKNALIGPLKDLIKRVFLLKLTDIAGNQLRSLSYPVAHEVIDLSGGRYATGIALLIRRIGLPSAPPAVQRSPAYYEMSGVFQPARPATELFSELKREIERGVIDQKYLYWDVRAALRWQKIAELSTYMTSQMSTNLLVVHAGDIVETICSDAKCEEMTFINLGVGTGVKDYHILSHLLRRTRKVTYFAVDESFPMIQLTMKTLEELMSTHRDPLSARYIVDDFANLPRHVSYIASVEPQGAPRIIGFLGGSLGNFNEGRILETARGLMVEKDYLLLGVEYIGGRDDETLKRNYTDRLMKEFLFGPIMDVTGSGPDWERDFKYEVLAGAGAGGPSGVGNTKTIVGKVIYNGKEIELFFSTKYAKEDLERFLTQKMKLDILAVFTSPEEPPRYGKYILRLARKTR